METVAIVKCCLISELPAAVLYLTPPPQLKHGGHFKLTTVNNY